MIIIPFTSILREPYAHTITQLQTYSDHHILIISILKELMVNNFDCFFIAGLLKSAYSLTWGAHRIWGQDGGQSLALL